ncbi:MaoC family dehydratase N-terminal domain-containing protein [Sphingomonas canadensis]|uniref:MaoC family dehydratase N-terminal domain-containing protein n=1 Tax=Sphingomonas canadensis TaxID=1219257 RepID=A0ABW3H7W0_9SPHN|nr:MaoC family dehydratase N-terminal domain-containing protein [Sphingomonas canadensis]MCW3836941.1 MaoC family dehydratase N-terminal domain-containing protein [Sphingomonas canadensis]
MIDRAHIGLALPAYVYPVEAFQLRLFAKAVGETRPEYLDSAAARAAGYRDIPCAPSFPFCIGMNPADPFDMLAPLGVDLGRVLHGEQAFDYAAPICAGDRVRVERRITDIFDRKGGALEFIVIETQFRDEATGALFCSARQSIVVRNPEPRA